LSSTGGYAHQRALEAAHKELLASLCSDHPTEISLSNDNLYRAANLYEKAMGIVKSTGDGDDEEDYYDCEESRWVEVFNRTFCREIRKRGTGFVLCNVFDGAMRAALLAVGQFWPDEAAAPKPAKAPARLRAA
jgi:hypothetical protein